MTAGETEHRCRTVMYVDFPYYVYGILKCDAVQFVIIKQFVKILHILRLVFQAVVRHTLTVGYPDWRRNMGHSW